MIIGHQWVNCINAWECSQCGIRRSIVSDVNELTSNDLIPAHKSLLMIEGNGGSKPFPLCSEVKNLKVNFLNEKGHTWVWKENSFEAKCSVCNYTIRFSPINCKWTFKKSNDGWAMLIEHLEHCDNIMMQKALK